MMTDKYSLKRCVALLVAVFAVGACSGASGYKGDGKLIDNGPSAATDRYVLDLGPLDLARNAKSQFRMANLPAEVFVAGLQLTPDKNGVRQRLDKNSTSAVVSMEVMDQQGNVVLKVSKPLSDWTWSASSATSTVFVYGGYGVMTSFKPERERTYTVSVDVLQPDQAAQDILARLLLKGGGWK